MGMFTKIEDWLWSVALKKLAVKVAILIVSYAGARLSPALLTSFGVHVDWPMFQESAGSVLCTGLFLLKNRYEMWKKQEMVK